MATGAQVNHALADAGRTKEFISPDPGNGGSFVTRGHVNCLGLTIGASAETRTVKRAAYVGQEVHLYVDVAGGGTCTVTMTGGIYSAAGAVSSDVALSAAGSHALFRGIRVAGTLKWARIA